MDQSILDKLPMEVITQSDYQLKNKSITGFDSKARESYFEMLEVALRNLSIVDQKKQRRKILVHT